MRFVTRFLPTIDGLYKRRAKIAGFVAGAFGMALLGAFTSVVATGNGFGLDDPTPRQIYTNF